ncbi:hypothetical protein Asi02nite_48320 [Asanoa siamensis]|uniref:DUF222 domain-containing protein n=1 Tax=Asanoa siamensis TaxID=926357 RepID=A0ABQ4CVK0_9ACTN|nr:hypothetical protein Asi02nite_48320 [Asanoa siamensis]
MKAGEVGYEDVADALVRARGVAAGLPLSYRPAHAADLSRTLDRIGALSEELVVTRQCLAGLSDWELNRLVPASLKQAIKLRESVDRSLGRTISKGPGATSVLDAECEYLQAILSRALERANDLVEGRSFVSLRELAGESGSISLTLVRLTAQSMPLLFQGRYRDEFTAELLEQQSERDRLRYVGRIAVCAWGLRKSLKADVPGRVVAGEGETGSR